MIYGSAEFKERLLNMLVNSASYFSSGQKQDQADSIYNDPYKHFAYRIACSHADDMAVHLYGDLPYKILNRVRPREDPETKAYRLQSYETITKSTADKALSIVSKVFNPSLYSIRFEESNDKADMLEEYAMDKYPYCGSVINYLHEVGLRKMIADPNGVFVVKPAQYPIDETVRVQPIIKIYGSKNIWYKDLESYLVFLRCENVKDTLIYYFEWYDKTQIIEFAAWVTNPQSLVIQETVTYQTGFLPVWELKGNTEVQDNGLEIHKSFFEPAVSFWNKAINHESDLDGAYINHMHPIRTELTEECDYVASGLNQRCKGGFILDPNNGSRGTCPGCNGTGYKSVKSPFGVYRIDHDRMAATGTGGGIKPVEYVTVPTEPTAMLEKRIETLLEKGLYALNMDVVNKIGENQSGKAKVIDRGELYDFLYKISSVIFDTHAVNIFHYFNLFMFGVEALNPGQGEEELNSIEPEIAKPVMFDITTAVEMIAEYKNSKEAGINPTYLKVKQIQINSKEFASDEDLKDYLNLVLECDPLPQISEDQIIANSLEGWYRKYDPIIHANIESFVKRAVAENPEKNDVGGFANMDDKERYAILIKYAKEVEDDNKQTIDAPLQLDANGKPIQPIIDPNDPQSTQQASAKILNQAIVTHAARGAYGK